MLRLTRARVLLGLAALLTALALTAVEADARSRGGNFGSRGSRTYSAPPPTATAPKTAAPINRSMTQQTAPSAARPGASQPGGFFGRGLLGGLAAGFLGAGLLGMLMGHGFLGGLAGFASFIGFLLQIAILGGIAYLLWNWWQRRSQPATASGPALRDMPGAPGRGPLGLNGLGGGLGGSAAPPAPQGKDEIGIGPSDYDAFERLLGEVQTAYAAEDLNALRSRATPEIVSYFAEELAENASRGLVNRVDDVKLLQGDLAEAWREGDVEYATVAMRYAMRDRMVERASGRVVEGSAEHPIEITELWTFMRSRGGGWLLSAIQET